MGPVLEKVPVACVPVALVVKFSVLPLTPLVIVIVGTVVEVGEPETVPMALPAVALVLSERVFVPVLTEIVVAADGIPKKVPVACDPVPLLVKLRVFPPFLIVIALPVSGELANVPVCVAAVDRLSVRVTVPPVPTIVTV